MRKSVCVLAVLAVLLTLVPLTASAEQPKTKTWTKHYRDLYLSGESEMGHFPHVWDLTDCDLTLSFTYDANGLQDDAGTVAWSEFGVRTVGYYDWNPSGAGIWLVTDYDRYHGVTNTFDPDPEGAPIFDWDDKLILQKARDTSEGAYNLPETPPYPWEPWASHAVWFDRDGVDDYEKDKWGYIDGVTYNTNGIYRVKIALHATDAGTGEAFMKVNGEWQGFWKDASHEYEPDLWPAGMTFTGDMTQMQVFYALSGYVPPEYGTTHSVAFTDIIVEGCLSKAAR